MPKSTFYNLNIEKREKIEEAIKNEFSRNSFSKASISNIIEEANIPRGSFYQYFEDKEDAIKYVISNFIILEKQKIKQILKINNGDIFDTAVDIFKYVIEKDRDSQEIILFRNILQKLKEENVNIFEEIRLEENLKGGKISNTDLINIENLNIKEKNDIKYIMKILSVVLRNEIIEIISLGKNKEDGIKDLKNQIEILKRGLKDKK